MKDNPSRNSGLPDTLRIVKLLSEIISLTSDVCSCAVTVASADDEVGDGIGNATWDRKLPRKLTSNANDRTNGVSNCGIASSSSIEGGDIATLADVAVG
jgi:hypothetical protein